MPNYIADTPTSTNLEEELLSGDAWLFNQPGLIEPIFLGLLHYGSETRLEAIKDLLAITVSAAQSEADSARRVVVSRHQELRRLRPVVQPDRLPGETVEHRLRLAIQHRRVRSRGHRHKGAILLPR
ncbi:hypothetical protein B7Z17_05180 [Candidatus Saccharibacteria bacterium 32-49-10]|nr:MAG: hypothetical protein B7Z17_05180 [Candidatus Saccharibacteria bacterium 32-49-10]